MSQWGALSSVLRPRMVRRLGELGVLDPRRALGGAAALPWLAGRGASLGLLSQINALSRPRRRALVDARGELTWWELDQRVNRLAQGWPTLGVDAGTQVAVLLRNGREFCEVLLAAQKVGVVAAPMNTWGKARELGAILARSQPAALVYDTRHAAQIAGAVPSGTRLVAVGALDDALPGSTPYDDVLAGQRGWPPAPLAARRGSTRLHISTSGTTGVPKAAARSAGVRGAAALLGLLDAVPYRHDDVCYIPNPLFHAFGLGVFAAAMGAGATMVLPDAFDPRAAYLDLARHRVTAASLVPVMLRRMLDLPDAPAVDLPALRILLVSGSTLPADPRRRALERFGDVLYDLYGSTEAGWVAIATPRDMRRKPDSVGRPSLGVQVAILDGDGRRVREGVGEVHVRSGITFDDYASGEEPERRGGFLSTGDLGYLDADGFLHIVGRADDMVVVGGENVHPGEVEHILRELPDVEDAAVLGVDDPEMGEVLSAFVVGSASVEALRAACEAELASYKVPRHFEQVEELPRTATGKVLRRDLAEEDG
jgi:fatty-acyl-CoA synthase